MIDVIGVSKEFAEVKAVNKATVKIKRGHIHGLLGPNGAGKTTLIRSIVGLYDIDEGQIRINDEILTRDNHALKSKIGVVTQHINLDKELTLEENLEFAGRLYGLPKALIKERKAELLKAFNLDKAKDRQVKKSSGGMKRKLMIAKALIHDPELIILDEPTVGIDVKARKEIWEMLIRLRNEGKTMLLTTHYIEEAEYLSDMISMIHNGEIFHTDTVDALVEALGTYCYEYQEGHHIIKAFYETNDEANHALEVNDHKGAIRSTQLEDVYTELIETKVKDSGN
jgi:ABC-2 type transport system ATP-binding protein